MTKPRLFLRIGIVCLFATLTLSLALSFFGGDLLPDELRNWDQKSGDPSRLATLLGFAFEVFGTGIYIISLIGLFFFRRWAAFLMLAVTVIFSLLLLLAPTVEPGITAFVGAWDSVLTGAVLTLAFFTDALDPGQG